MRRRTILMLLVTFGIFISFCSLSISFVGDEKAKFSDEPADPEEYDMSVWQTVEKGIHSGFGSIDVAYPRSVPPAGKVEYSNRLHGWKGERVSVLLLVWSAWENDMVTIEASEFRNDRAVIGKENVSVSVIRYVLTDEFANGCGPREIGSIPAHIKPDLLSGTNSFTIRPRENRPVWIAIDIPRDAGAGNYTGSIRVQSGNKMTEHPVALEVQNKELPSPSAWSFHLDLWQNPFAVARYHKVELWSKEHFGLLRPLLTKLANAGQKCITTTIVDKPWDSGTFDPFGTMVKWTRKKDGTWKYDYSIFDQYVSLAMECGIKEQINCYSMVPISNKFSWYDEKTGKTVVEEAIPGTEKYASIWSGFLKDFRVHLRQKSWLNITTIALDEREEEEMKSMFRFLEQTAPEFKITMAGFYYKDINSSIYDFSTNWRHVGKISGGVMESRKKAGLKTTYYVACGIPKPNNFTFSPPAESCYEGWFAAANGFDGFLRWAYNSWPEKPVVDSRFRTWPSGDTYLVYPNALSSVRFERLREGIQDFEKIKILSRELSASTSGDAAIAMKKLDLVLDSIHTSTLTTKTAAEVINYGKQVVYDIVNSMYQGESDDNNQPVQESATSLLGNRFFTFNTVVRVRQIEVSRDVAYGPDESGIHSPVEARAFREAVEKGWPGAKITWAFSWLALKDQRANYQDLKKLVVSYHKKYGDEITFIPGAYFSNMYNTREQVNRDLHEGLQMVSEMVGGGYRPKAVVAGFLAAENLRYLAEKENIHVCQGNIWSQYGVDNGDGEGSISYPYYPSTEHFCKPSQGKEDFIDCVNLDGWTVDFLNAKFPQARIINGIRCGSRQGVGPIETILRQGTELGTKEMLATTAAHFNEGYKLNQFAWVTCTWELGLVEGRKIYGYDGRNGLDGLVIWLSEMRRRWPDAKCITLGEFGLLWRKQYKNNDSINYRFVQRGSGVCGSDPDIEIRWFMNKDFRMAFARNWKEGQPEKLIDFTRYDLTAREPDDPKPGQFTRNWSLMNRLNQKGIRPQDKPIELKQLGSAELAMIKRRYPELAGQSH